VTQSEVRMFRFIRRESTVEPEHDVWGTFGHRIRTCVPVEDRNDDRQTLHHLTIGKMGKFPAVMDSKWLR
jgi:hypothetical protein